MNRIMDEILDLFNVRNIAEENQKPFRVDESLNNEPK
jgi:hypothetical protein